MASSETRTRRAGIVERVSAQTGFDLFPDRAVVAIRVNGELKDKATTVSKTDTVEPVDVSSPDGLDILRHSTGHVMAQAIQKINPDAKLGIGPPVTDGFYYDFDVADPFTPEDLKAIEKEMDRIIRSGQRFQRRVVTEDEARKELAGEPYKLELVGLKKVGHGEGSGDDGESVEVGGAELTIYDNVSKDGETVWKDLCRGPHVPNTGALGVFKLMRIAAAYWRGSEKNPQLQRIYGTAWPTKDELKAYTERLEEAAKRDHRKLGRELDLFSFPEEIGSGLSVWHPKGGLVRMEMEQHARRRHIEAGYTYVYTPHIAKQDLFLRSNHLVTYKEGMFPPIVMDEERDADGNVTKQGVDYYLKPMNCPMHILIYDERARSYRDLPMRLAENGTVYRNELSGALHGLTRVRGFTQDDAHLFVTPEQLEEETTKVLDFVISILRDFGLEDFELELSMRDEHKDKWIGSDEFWEYSTNALRNVARSSGLKLTEMPGEAAFYGPKIDLKTRDAIGRVWQLVHRAGRPEPSRALRTRVHRHRRAEEASDHDPPRAVRIDRAVLRDPARALCRRLPGLAVPGAGRRHPGRGRVRRIPRRDHRPAAVRGRPRRARLLRRPDAEEDPQRGAGQGAFPVDRGGAGSRGRHRELPLPQRGAGQRHPGR